MYCFKLNSAIPAWAVEQLALRNSLEDWIESEIDLYEAEGFERLFGSKGGHELDEAGGYTRSFASMYCLNGNERILRFMKRFRDEWHQAVTQAGHFYHGYDSNEAGDYITHTAEAFSQFLLNVLYLDITDEKTISMAEDAAEHLGNWNSEVPDWYDWDNHVFLSYFLGTRSPYHRPPYNCQSSRHFRVLAIASAAYEATGKKHYLELCKGYWKTWSKRILETPDGEEHPMMFKLVSDDEISRYASQKEIRQDWRFNDYYRDELSKLGLLNTNEAQGKNKTVPTWKHSPDTPFHMPHDLMMTMLDVLRFTPQDVELREGLRRTMKRWIDSGPDGKSQIAGIEPHCGIHLPKYRDITGDTSLDSDYIKQWLFGPCSYLITGDPQRLTGVAPEANATFRRALIRNSGALGAEYVVKHACDKTSNAGTSSAYVMPALFTPALGGLGIHFGRAPWLNVLYYSDGELGLPAGVAALYAPPCESRPPKVTLANCSETAQTIAIRRIIPVETTKLMLTQPQPAGLVEVTLAAGEVVEANIWKGSERV